MHEVWPDFIILAISYDDGLMTTSSYHDMKIPSNILINPYLHFM